jgi:YD repeat-containing protein
MGPSGGFQQAPVRSKSVVGAQVYSHSGEFSPQVFDLELPSRGVGFQFLRKYSSARYHDVGLLGRGWTFAYNKRIERDGDCILYHDGFWRSYRFASAGSGFLSPDGFYALLEEDGNCFSLKQRTGDLFVFENPDSGGRLLSIEDRHGNTLLFEYLENQISVTDPFGRRVIITLERNRVVELRDHTQRSWEYAYDQNDCLVEVIQPPIQGLPDRPRVRYAYDEDLRLISITDPKDQRFLRNSYDAQGRVKRQEHGDGTIEFEYDMPDQPETGLPVFRTRVKLKNGALLALKHDPAGHVIERTLQVSAGSLSPLEEGGEGMVPLTTTSAYNRHGELIHRIYPAGNSTEWIYDQDHVDPRAQGNLLRVTRFPLQESGENGQPLTTRYTYEPLYQQRESMTDARGYTTSFAYDSRGNLARKIYPDVTIQHLSSDADSRGIRQVQLIDRFDYNEAGQLIRFTDPSGASIAYFYYPTNDPTGDHDSGSSQNLVQTAGGYLARIVRDPAGENRPLKATPANLITGFGYDDAGNVTTILDGNNNPTRLEFDGHNHLVRVTSRQPHNYTTSFRYDANGNMVEGTLSFDHHEYDPDSQEVVHRTTEVRQGFEYNQLNNIVERSVGAGDREKATRFIRDAAENIVREIQPMGNVTEYDLDERNQVTARCMGVGTADEVRIRHTYTLNGRLGSTTDGCGSTTLYNFDGFHRYEGFQNAGGTLKKQWRDETGNVTRVQVLGEAVSFHESGEPVIEQAQTLLESWFQYDELNRLVRMDRAWRDTDSGESVGHSKYDGKEGIVSSLVQYGENHLPSRLWTETGNILHIQYDGAGRASTISEETGESVTIQFDGNSNPVRVERLGPSQNEGEQRFRQVIRQQFDELDRLVTRSVNEEPIEVFSYNALGALLEYRSPAGASVRALQDSFGRFAGGITTATTADTVTGEPVEQTLLQRVEWDGNGRMSARINAHGNATRYTYDALNRLSGTVYADGIEKRLERDGAGNVTRVVNPNQTVVKSRFDALNRLVERYAENGSSEDRQVERYHYDGLNRLVAALTPNATTLRHFDSLSRLVEETQSGRRVQHSYDSAGNRTFTRYPGGQEIHKTHDLLGRVVEVQGQSGPIASYSYRAGTQVNRQQLGDVLYATYTYEPGKDWLSSVIYRSIETGEAVEGRLYRYDAAGNRIQEVRLRRGSDFGERYFYDSANRLVKVQYGVERLADPVSPFNKEVIYELGPTGTWQRQTVRDANGQTLEQADGVVNQREQYVSLGDRRFEYDANGNRVLEESGSGSEHPFKRYRYDYANRMVGAELLDSDGQIVQRIDYSYDAFGRQVLKRISKDGRTSELIRFWNGRQLAEEWEDGRLVRSFVYGGRFHEPVQLELHSDEDKEYLYVLDGKGSVSALVDDNARPLEEYHYDVNGKPFISTMNGPAIHNPLLTGSQLYDYDTGLSVLNEVSYDASTAQTTGVTTSADMDEPPGPYVGTYSDVPVLMTPDPRIPPEGGKSEYIPPIESEDYLASIGANAAVIGILGFFAIESGLGALGWHLPKGVGAAGHVGWELIWTGVKIFGKPVGGSNGDQGGNGSVGTNGGSTGSGGSQGGGNQPSGQPEDRPFGNGVDYGHEGGGKGSGNSDKGSGGSKEPSSGSDTKSGSTLTNDGMTVNGEHTTKGTDEPVNNDPPKDDKGGSGNMPNPEDGTGEGIDKDWWRDLPPADALSLAQALKSPIKLDEREQTPYLALGSLSGTDHLLSVLTPPPVTVDENGIIINLQGVQSTGTSSGTTTSDGWGDKPRSLAEAYAAPRIRDASTSRF